MKNFLLILAFALVAGVFTASAQPRMSQDSQSAQSSPNASAPESFEAKYEGGMFGFDDKEEGMLKFDDANERLVFFGKAGKEKFSIPYSSIQVVYTGKKSVRSAAGTAVSVIPLPGAGLDGLIREKRRYLVIQFSDPDVEARGVTNFKLENDRIRETVIQTIGAKAKLTQRGDAFYRMKSPVKNDVL